MASAATMTVVVVSLYCEGQPPLLSPPFPPLSPSSSSSKQDDLDRKGLEILTGHADLSTTTTTTNLLVAATTSGHTALNDVNDNKVEPKLAVVFQPKVLSFSCDVRLEQMSSSGLGKKGRTCTMEKKYIASVPQRREKENATLRSLFWSTVRQQFLSRSQLASSAVFTMVARQQWQQKQCAGE